MFDKNEYTALPRGSERMQYLRNCISESDREKNYRISLELRHLFIEESIFGDDNYSAIIMFPEYMAMFDKHSEEHNTHTFMYSFKWIIEDIANFPQVTVQKAEELYAEFRKRCKLYGYSLRPAYMKQAEYYIPIDSEKVHELAAKYKAEPSDDLSDGIADETSLDIKLELEYGSEEKAVQTLNNMLARGISSTEVPERTYGVCVEHFTRKGNYAEAEHYANLLLPMINGKSNYLMEIAFIILAKSNTDLYEAVKIFRKHLGFFLSTKNTRMIFYFSEASARLFENLSVSGNDTVRLILPASFELYKKHGEYSTAELGEYFRKIAEDTAEKFDKCYKTSYYTDKLNAVFPENPENNSELPAHGSAQKTSSTLAIPFADSDSVPDYDTITEKLRSVKELTLRESSIDEERNVIIITFEDNENGNEITYNIIDLNLNITIDTLCNRHGIPEEKLHMIKESDTKYLVILTEYNKNFEQREYKIMLKIADILNLDGSPAIIDTNTLHLLSSEWVHCQAESVNLPYDRYMYQVAVSSSDKNEKMLDVHTYGLKCFGSRDIEAFDIDRNCIQYAVRAVEQLASNICSVADLPDEGEIFNIGIVYNNEKYIPVSWKRVSEVYPEYADTETGENALLFLHPERDGQGIQLSEVTREQFEKLTFHKSRPHYMLEESKSNESFKTAAEFFMKSDNAELIVGFDIEQDEKNITVYAGAVKGISEKLSGIIIECDENDKFKKGDTVEINSNTVFTWQMRDSEKTYTADDEYILRRYL